MNIELLKNTELILKHDHEDRINEDNIRILLFLNQAHLSARSRSLYEWHIRKFFNYWSSTTNLSLDKFTDIHIQVYISSLEHLKPASKNTALRSISSLFTYLTKVGYIPRNPSAVVRRSKEPRNIEGKVLSQEQIEMMLSMCGNNLKHKMVIYFLFVTAIRVSELISLKPSNFRDVNDGALLTVLGKGSKYRSIFIPELMYTEMRSFILSFNEDEKIFKITANGAWWIVKTIGKRAGVKTHPHAIRHSVATMAAESNMPLHTLASILGHESIATTSIYLHASGKDSLGNYVKKPRMKD